MRNTIKTLVAALALTMTVACADQDDTSSDTKQVAAGETQAAAATTAKHVEKGTHHAGRDKHHAKHADPVAHADKLAEYVGLDDAQKAQALALFKDESLSWDERKAKLNDIMTPEQRAKLKAAHGKHGKHGKHHKFSAEKAKLHADKLQDKLGITDAQKAAVQSALAAGDWTKLETILTADQFEELKRLKRTHGYHGKHKAGHGSPHNKAGHDCAEGKSGHDCAHGKSGHDCAHGKSAQE